MGPCFRRDDVVRDRAGSRLEKIVSRILRGALLGHGRLQPFDFRSHQRDALGEFLDRQQRKVLPDLVGDFLPRFVVILGGHAFLPCSTISCQPARGWLIRCRLKFLAFGQGQIMEKLPAQMTVVGISKPGGPEVLVPETRAVPAPGPGEILIKFAATRVNRPDVAQRSGSYPPPPGASDLPGLEVAGEVVAVGPGATKHKVGDKVMSLVAGGGYAQFAIAQDAQAIAVAPALAMLGAGAIPETLMTVWHNVFERGALKPGETLLIHGGSSGIGTMAIQLAKAFGSKVIVTVGSKDKADACVRLGADRAINYKTEEFVAEVKTATSGAGANVILDMVGGDYIERNYDAAAVEGRVVQIALLGGPKATVNFAKLMVKRLHHTGSTLRPRSNTDKAAMVAAIEARVMPLLREGRVKPLMDSTFPLKRPAEAHRRREPSKHMGKIVWAFKRP